MVNAVVILGAGASADFGVPTLSGMFNDPVARRYILTKARLHDMLKRFFWNPRGHSIDTAEKCLNIEQMLTLLKDLEKAKLLPTDFSEDDLHYFRRALNVLIKKAVYDGKHTKQEHLNPLIHIFDKTFDHTTWASFNWDCIFEASFWYSRPWGGPGSRSNPSLAIDVENWRYGTTRHHYLKLHGGINWWLINDKITYVRWGKVGTLDKIWGDYDKDPEMPHRPVILEPSFYKYDDSLHKQLQPQWDFFLARLLEAQSVLIVGYSLPEMDVNARSKILTGFQANDASRWLVVNSNEPTCDLYGRLLGNRRLATQPISLAGFNTCLLYTSDA
ncbi:MAG: hypothetical protein QUS09_02145, partial [Methanotrichaceae archaeon]|nr:hypothetical protein [Methanotrichaceae archaeon]